MLLLQLASCRQGHIAGQPPLQASLGGESKPQRCEISGPDQDGVWERVMPCIIGASGAADVASCAC